MFLSPFTFVLSFFYLFYCFIFYWGSSESILRSTYWHMFDHGEEDIGRKSKVYIKKKMRSSWQRSWEGDVDCILGDDVIVTQVGCSEDGNVRDLSHSTSLNASLQITHILNHYMPQCIVISCFPRWVNVICRQGVFFFSVHPNSFRVCEGKDT